MKRYEKPLILGWIWLNYSQTLFPLYVKSWITGNINIRHRNGLQKRVKNKKLLRLRKLNCAPISIAMIMM